MKAALSNSAALILFTKSFYSFSTYTTFFSALHVAAHTHGQTHHENCPCCWFCWILYFMVLVLFLLYFLPPSSQKSSKCAHNSFFLIGVFLHFQCELANFVTFTHFDIGNSVTLKGALLWSRWLMRPKERPFFFSSPSPLPMTT